MHFLLRAASVGCLLTCSALAFGESIDPVDEIVVSGARTPIGVSRLGSAATVVTRAQIENRQVRYVADLLRSEPGFEVSQTGVTGTQTQVRVRGSEANHVLVLIDGIRVNDPATSDEFRWEHLSTAGIERIEIVRGPQSALWGSDAVGAVVNVITRSRDSGERLGLSLESGSNSTLNLSARGSASLGGWNLSGSVESLDTDGENISRTGSEDDASDLSTVTLGAGYSFTDSLSMSTNLRWQEGSTETDPVDFSTGLPTDADRRTDSENRVASIGFELQPGETRQRHSLLLSYFDSEHVNRVDGLEDSSTEADRLTVRLQSDLPLADNLLALAVEHEESDFSQRGAIGFGDPNQDQSMHVSSAIAEFQYLSVERMSVILTGRFDSYSDFDNALTGRLSFAYSLTENSRLRASVGRAQKAPTFTERFGFFPGQFLGNPDLEPETSLSYEIGLDQTLLDGAVLLGASLYAQDLDNEINGFAFDTVNLVLTAVNRTEESKRSGVELDARILPADWFDIRANYTYTDSSEVNTSAVRVREIRRPRHSGSAAFNARLADDRLNINLVADYGGTRTDVFFPPLPADQQTVTLSNYWLLDLAVSYRLSSTLQAFVRGANILDEDYEQVFGYRTPGRAAFVGIRADFGR
ncbi:MAG: TonB-dependent receptor [Pseudomonadota bacterium]